MSDKHLRQDKDTAQQIREALAMKRAFGIHAAATFLRFRAVPVTLAARVLAAPPEQRRQF